MTAKLTHLLLLLLLLLHFRLLHLHLFHTYFFFFFLESILVLFLMLRATTNKQTARTKPTILRRCLSCFLLQFKWAIIRTIPPHSSSQNMCDKNVLLLLVYSLYDTWVSGTDCDNLKKRKKAQDKTVIVIEVQPVSKSSGCLNINTEWRTIINQSALRLIATSMSPPKCSICHPLCYCGCW